ncbi:MAG: acyl carrier protein [Clostridia bacterium]|nr:acyl carrier protein [Clostridia bacterium]
MNQNDFFRLVAACTGRDAQSLSMEQQLVADLNVNSLSVLLFLVRLEDEYGVRLADTQLTGAQSMTMGDLWTLICQTGR